MAPVRAIVILIILRFHIHADPDFSARIVGQARVVQAAAKRRLLLLPLGPNSNHHTVMVVTPIVGNEMNTRHTSFGR